MFARQLGRELVALIVIKVAALSLLFFLFFSDSQPPVDGNATARAMLERGAVPTHTRP